MKIQIENITIDLQNIKIGFLGFENFKKPFESFLRAKCCYSCYNSDYEDVFMFFYDQYILEISYLSVLCTYSELNEYLFKSPPSFYVYEKTRHFKDSPYDKFHEDVHREIFFKCCRVIEILQNREFERLKNPSRYFNE